MPKVYLLILCSLISNFCGQVRAGESFRIALTGSSITWGEGLLDESFVGVVDRCFRTQMAKTIMAADMSYNVTPCEITNPKFYQGTAKRITGQGNSVSFVLTSKSLSIVQGIERSHNNTSIIDLYVDGKLYDSFTNYNPSLLGSEVKEFIGDGSTVKFDLGRCFTYAHKVTVNKITQMGALNTAGYGGSFPGENDYLIIRKYIVDPQPSEVAVHHVLWFRTPPAIGAKIKVTYDYGENICYAKTTVGELGCGFETGLESRYGDDNLDLAPKAASSLSSGLDFRATDERAIKTWEFEDTRKRHFEFRIRGLNKTADPAGTPYFIINFATDRMHRIMNAGIGGWTAERLAIDPGLRNLRELMQFEPDLILFESGTNDDWSKGQFVCTRKVAGITESQVKTYPSLWLKALTYLGSNNYIIETCELLIQEASERSITFDAEAVDFGDIKAGDILVVGDYHGDERGIQCRLLESWDPKTKRAQFSEPLKLNPLFGVEKFEDFAGKKVRVKRVDDFIAWMQNCVDTMRAFKPNVAIGIVDTGLSNYYTRTLLGYPQKLKEFCEENGFVHVNAYEVLKAWQYSQPRNITAYLGPDASDIATGQEAYQLVDFNGQDLHQATGSTLLRNWSVKVNGQEVYGKDCYVDGGQIMGVANNQNGYELEFSNWQFPRVYKFAPTKLVFFRSVPAAGSTVEIKCTSTKWSSDDTHPNSFGAGVYGQAIIDKVPLLLEKRDRKYEATEASASIGDSSVAFKLYQEEDNFAGAFAFPGQSGLYKLKACFNQETQGELQLLAGGCKLEAHLSAAAGELELLEPIFLNKNELITISTQRIVLKTLSFLPWERTIPQKPISWKESPRAATTENIILIQAEDYLEQGGGKCSFLTTHQPRYGSGIMDWGPPGHWLEWEVEIPQSGTYIIMLGAATTYLRVIRALTIDGGYPQPELACLEFTNTGGWGRSPEHWADFLLHDESLEPIRVELSEGTHRLRLTSIYSWMNLDYIALCKVE